MSAATLGFSVARGLGAAVLALTLGLGGTALAQAPKAYQNRAATESALKLEARLKRESQVDARPVAELIKQGVAQIRANSWREASVTMALAAGKDPRNEQAWRNLSVALTRIETDDYDEKQRLRDQAVGAAWKAFEVSPDAKTRGRALAVLANAYTVREEWRPALDAYKASLAQVDSADVKSAYAAMRAEYGFRALDYSVDSDAAAPRACVQFSEEIAKGRVDFSPYVVLKGVDAPAVSGEASQICVDGLKHGETYDLTIRAGLPSDVDETLPAAKDFRVYVRDRKPTVRFTGRNYVLPSTGQQGVPVVSTNVDAVLVDLYRIGDRSLAPAVVSGDFQKQLDGEALEKLKTDSAATIYSGELSVERKQNADVVTAFPVSEAAPKLSPGVYVLAARPKNAVEGEPWDARATQWFVVSDLGVTAVSGTDGVKAFARSLASAAPLAGVEFKLIARDNEVLAAKTTDADGFVSFEAGLTRGTGGQAPAVLVASADGDYGFLDLTKPAFDLSDRGVGGRAAPGPLDAQLFAERGVYRPKETVHLTALLRDDKGAGVAGLPLTLVVTRPDGVEDRRAVTADAGAGGRTLDVALIDQAMGGTWRVEAFADVKGAPIGATSFLVADYVPEKLDLKIAAKTPEMTNSGANVAVDGRWLYGAPAADLALEGDVTLRVREGAPAGFEGYRFGLSDEVVAPVRTPIDGLGRTDAKGQANVRIAEPPLPETTRPLEAEVALRLAEPSGRTLERKLTLPVATSGPSIGVKPLFSSLGDGETARFDVRIVGPDGKPAAAQGLGWELKLIETSYQWYASNGRWSFETVNRARRVADGKLDVTADAAAWIDAKVGYGRYRLEVSSADPQGPATSVAFDAGYFAAASADSPDMLDVALDKPAYRPGETATATLASRFAGKATVMVVGAGVIDQKIVDVSDKGATASFAVTDAWRPGAYVVAFVHRPLDAKASRMPGRAVGVAHAKIDAADRTIGVAIGTPERMEPRRTLDAPVKLTGIAAGEKAYLSIAAVDVGILNLTGYKPPAPDEEAFGQRKLAAELRDLYGQLIDGMGAKAGKLRSGGDDSGSGGLKDAPTQAPLALFSGVVTVGPSGEAVVPFEIPAFNGTVKLMAVAWTGTKLGHAAKDVVVADPVVVSAALPRFLADGDRSRLRLDLDNVSGAAGDYQVDVKVSDPLAAADASRKVTLGAKARAAVEIALAAKGVGPARLDVSLKGPDGRTLAQALAIDVRPATSPVARRNVIALAKGASVTVSKDMLADIVPGTGSVALSVGKPGQLDAATFKLALDTYPYACSEQLSSRLLAVLYGDEAGLAAKVAGVSPEEVKTRANDMIARILSRQDSNGSFGLWSASGGDLWLDAYVTDVFGRARAAGYAVPDVAFSQALDNLRNAIGLRQDATESDIAYAHYVLAKSGRALIGDLRYLADVKIEEFASPLARAQIGAALAQTGDLTRAARAFAAAEIAPPDDQARSDYGSVIRDQAAILAVASESRAGAAVTPAVLRRLGTARRDRPAYLTTQENAWLLLAARGLKAQSADLALSVDGQPHKGVLDQTFSPERLAQGGATIANAGQTPLEAVVTVKGSPTTPEPAAESGFRLERRYYTMAGVEVDPAKVAQNSRLVVALTVTEPEPRPGRVLVVDRLPAGLEIDNPKLVSSATSDAFAFLGESAEPAHSEFRDDRFVAAFDREADGPAVYSAAYVVRAVAPGRYAHPAASVEDMYRAERFARTGAGAMEVTAGR